MRGTWIAVALSAALAAGAGCRREVERREPTKTAAEGPGGGEQAEAVKRLEQLTAEHAALKEKMSRLEKRAAEALEMEQELDRMEREMRKLREAGVGERGLATPKPRRGEDGTGDGEQGTESATATDTDMDTGDGEQRTDSATAATTATLRLADARSGQAAAEKDAGAQDLLSSPLGDVSVLEMRFCGGVDRETREPVDERTGFRMSDENIYCWMHLANAAPEETKVILAWKHEGQEESSIELRVGSNAKRWRTWAHTRPSHKEPGEWEAELRDLSGKVLGSAKFTLE